MNWLILVGLSWVAPAPLLQQGDPTAAIVDGKLGASLDDYLSRSAAFGFSGSVLIEKEDKVILLKGYGLAERDPPRPNTPDTIFDIGSLSKQFTATAILRLEQDGKLATSDTLSKYFKDAPADKAKIQLHHLLSHTSGLPRAIQTVGSGMTDRAAMVKAVLGAPLESKPGEKFSYSNVGYDLLGAIVEIAGGASLEDYFRAQLFAPAQMATSGFRKDGKLSPALAARGYQAPWQPVLPGSKIRGETESSWDPTLATEGWYTWGLRGAGGVLSTVLDLRRWQQALDGKTLLKPASKEKLFHPVRDNYAYGWYVWKTDRGIPCIDHGGSTDNGFECKFTRFPEQRVLIIALGNLHGGSLPWVNLNLGKIVRGEDVAFPPPIGKPDSERMRALEGSWEAPGEARFQLSAQGELVVVEAQNAAALSWMLPSSSPRANALLKKTQAIAKDIAKDDFASLHAAEDRSNPLDFFDDWWRGLEGQSGKRTGVAVVGIASDPRGGDSSLIRVDFADGAEILKLAWSGETLTGARIGPPYPSRRVLQPTGENTWTEFDLIASKVLVELRSPAGDPRKASSPELAANGRNLVLSKRK